MAVCPVVLEGAIRIVSKRTCSPAGAPRAKRLFANRLRRYANRFLHEANVLIADWTLLHVWKFDSRVRSRRGGRLSRSRPTSRRCFIDFVELRQGMFTCVERGAFGTLSRLNRAYVNINRVPPQVVLHARRSHRLGRPRLSAHVFTSFESQVAERCADVASEQAGAPQPRAGLSGPACALP